ncbi:MAG: hypothetical protein K2N03_06345 [Muribaculaceae bacterium]|nr:hypothetical protein [Muribaculaceae bacterium]
MEIKKMRLMIMMLIAFMLGACSRSDDMEVLLGKVPSDAGYVIGVNVEELLKKGDIKDFSALPPAIEQYLNSHADCKKMLLPLFSEDSGIGHTAAVCFNSKGYDWVIAIVEDKAKAETALAGSGLGERGVIDGGILWISSGSPNKEEINRCMHLGESQSVLSEVPAKEMADMKKDIEVYGNISSFLSSSDMSFSDVSTIKLVLASLFNDAKYLRGGIVFEKGEMNGEFSVLNSKGKDAKLSLETSRLNEDFLKNISGKYDLLAGFSFSEKAVSKLIGQYANLLSLGGYGNLLEGFSGRMALGMNVKDFLKHNEQSGLTVVMEFKNGDTAGKASQGISNFLGSGVLVSAQGNNVIIGTTLPAGTSDSELIGGLNGSTLGVACNISGITEGTGATVWNRWDSGYMRAVPDGKGVRLEYKLTTKDKGGNALLLLLESIAQAGKENEAIKNYLYR